MRFLHSVILSCFVCLYTLAPASATFALVDTNPGSNEYKKRFMGSFGINGAIEPTITQEDRPLYESIEPHLKNNPLRAIELAERGVSTDSNAAFDFLLGSLHYTQNNFSKAEMSLKAALKKFPDFRRAHRNLSLIYIQDRRYDLAIMHLLRVIELGGHDGQSYSMIAYAHLNEEKYHSALSAYQMARMFLPDSIDVRRGEAQCLLMTNQYERAIALFDELLSEFPETQDYWLFQANAYIAQNQITDAIANIEIAHATAAPQAFSLSLLGDLYMSQDSYNQALINYKAAIQQNPNIRQESALRPLRHLISLGLFGEAQDYLNLINRTLAQSMSSAQQNERIIIAAQIEIEIGDPAQGLKRLKQVLEADPLNAEGLLLMANVQLQNEAYAEAQFYFERATQIAEAQVKGFIGLARTAVQVGKFTEALAYLKSSQNIETRSDVARFVTSIEKVLSSQ